MFPRRKRLSRAEFPASLRGGRRISSPNFSAILPKEARGYAVVVSKKVARLSVTRHRVKRHVLEAMRTIALPPALILFPSSVVAKMTFQDIREELASLLSKIPAYQQAGAK